MGGDYVSGVLVEHCGPSNSTIENLRAVSFRAKSQTRRLVYECHYKPSDGNLNDAIAAFMIGVAENQYFGLGAWEDRLAWKDYHHTANFSDHWVDGVFDRKL